MTYEEALNFKQKWNEIQAFNDLERYLLRDEPPAYKAVAVCMRAAKKQIPQKPIVGAFNVPKCPNCHMFDLVDEWDKHTNYCPNCGQAIDWSNKNE